MGAKQVDRAGFAGAGHGGAAQENTAVGAETFGVQGGTGDVRDGGAAEAELAPDVGAKQSDCAEFAGARDGGVPHEQVAVGAEAVGVEGWAGGVRDGGAIELECAADLSAEQSDRAGFSGAGHVTSYRNKLLSVRSSSAYRWVSRLPLRYRWRRRACRQVMPSGTAHRNKSKPVTAVT
ncbi:hypothetical protein GCM10017567_56800 [Amycolatopsis bullii]|uniref:Uncharacterized protein n=1 Tax=Amycolatopsis bullii TaxID=941987 RepID=A0ABQ3KJB9_9PSEU|nr:hypothetical protein GCM10017567_56800 [Amycolatopsis bullii]